MAERPVVAVSRPLAVCVALGSLTSLVVNAGMVVALVGGYRG